MCATGAFSAHDQFYTGEPQTHIVIRTCNNEKHCGYHPSSSPVGLSNFLAYKAIL